MKGYKRIYKAIHIYDSEAEVEAEDKEWEEYLIIDGDLYSRKWEGD